MKNSDLENLFDEMNLEVSSPQLGERLWIPIEKYSDCFSPSLTDTALINAFIVINDDWFTDKANSLYGLREQARDRLIRFLEENKENKLNLSFLEVLEAIDEDDDEDFRITYVLTKFVTEWIDPIKGVFQNSEVVHIGIDELKKKEIRLKCVGTPDHWYLKIVNNPFLRHKGWTKFLTEKDKNHVD
jgi:hypothetical protein